MAGSAGVCNSLCRWGIDCKHRWLEVILETQCNFSRASETSVQKGHFFLNNGDFWVLFFFYVLNRCFPCRVLGLGCARAYPSCIRAKAEQVPERVACSSHGPIWAFRGLVPCSWVPRQLLWGVLFFPQLGLTPRTKILFFSFLLVFTTYCHSFVIFSDFWLACLGFAIRSLWAFL